MLRAMTQDREVSRYRLYGESPSGFAPEFLHIEPISARSSLYEWTIAPHSHPGIHQLLLLEQGSGVLATDGAEHALQPVSAVTVPSGCVHAFRFDPGAEGWVLSLAADLLHDPRLAAQADFARVAGAGARLVRLTAGGRAAARLGWLLADLAADLADGIPGRLPDRVTAQLALLLAGAIEMLRGEGGGALPAGRRETLAERLRQLVDLHFRDGWSVDDYAAALGATTPTLTRACRAAFGKPPGHLVLDRVLLEAMRYLTYTASSVSQIAGNLGFADPAYFARFFRQRTGMTASAFRRERAWLRDGDAAV